MQSRGKGPMVGRAGCLQSLGTSVVEQREMGKEDQSVGSG